RREAGGPVLAVAAEKPHCPALDPRDQTVAVELDLVQPAVAARRDGRAGRELRLEPPRQRRLARARERRDAGRPARPRRDAPPAPPVAALTRHGPRAPPAGPAPP